MSETLNPNALAAFSNAVNVSANPDDFDATYPTDGGSAYPGDRSMVAPVLGTDGKPKPFYEQPSFYDGLLNFGAATLAASGETDADGVPMNGLAAIGKGVQAALSANREERATQSDIRMRNSQAMMDRINAQYKGVQTGLEQQRLSIAQKLLGDNGDVVDEDTSTSDTPTSGVQKSGMDTSFTNPATDLPDEQGHIPDAPLLAKISYAENQSRDPTKVNQYGFAGLYGIGTAALKQAGIYQPAPGESTNTNQWQGTINVPGYEPTNLQGFLQNPGMQTAAAHSIMHSNAKMLDQSGVSSLIGKTVNGQRVTEDSLLAAAWNAGAGGAHQYYTGGPEPVDGNNTKLSDYISKVTGYQPTLDDLMAIRGNQVQAATSMLGPNLDRHIRRLQQTITGLSMAGIPSDAQQAELNNLYAIKKSASDAQQSLITHNAETVYDVAHKPVSMRDAIAIPSTDANGNLIYNMQKAPHPIEVTNPATGGSQPGFLESNPDGTLRTVLAPGSEKIGEGELTQDKNTAERSSHLLTQGAEKLDAAKQNLGVLGSYQDALSDLPTGPGESMLMHLKSSVAATKKFAGIPLSDDEVKNLTAAQNITSFAGALNAHMFSTVHNVKNTVEFHALSKSIPGLDNTPQSLQFILSHAMGESLEDMSEATFVQNAAHNPDKYPQYFHHNVFDATAAQNDFHKNVTAMTYTYMMLNNSAQGRALVNSMYQANPNEIKSHVIDAQKSLNWLKSNGAYFDPQGSQTQ